MGAVNTARGGGGGGYIRRNLAGSFKKKMGYGTELHNNGVSLLSLRIIPICSTGVPVDHLYESRNHSAFYYPSKECTYRAYVADLYVLVPVRDFAKSSCYRALFI